MGILKIERDFFLASVKLCIAVFASYDQIHIKG